MVGKNGYSAGTYVSDSRAGTSQRYRWVMLGLSWLLYAAFGVVQRSQAPLVTPITQDLGITYAEMGIIMGAWPLTYVATSLVAGNIIDNWGIRRALFLGILIVGLSEALRYFAAGFVTLFIFVALFGVGGPMISIGVPKTISEWFKGKERAVAVGVYMTGPWLGGLVAYSATNSIVMPLVDYSWRLTFLSYSLLAFGAAVVWWFLAREANTASEEKTSIFKVFAALINLRSVQIILAVGFLGFAVIHGFNDWLPRILETSGLSSAKAGFIAALPTLVAIPAVLIIPRFVPAYMRGHLLVIQGIMIAGALVLIVNSSGALRILGLVLYGVCFSSLAPVLILILMDLPEVGSRFMGSAGGMFFAVAEIGGFIGPMLTGLIRDMTANFEASVYILAALAVIISGLAFLLKSKPMAAGGHGLNTDK
jgi:CP family cyanate transporter-like MFS transporter